MKSMHINHNFALQIHVSIYYDLICFGVSTQMLSVLNA